MLCAAFAARAQVDYKFIENKGQWPEQVAYRSDVLGGTLYLEKDRFTYDFRDESVYEKLHANDYNLRLKRIEMKCHAMQVVFPGANANVKLNTSRQITEYFNYFLGNDRSKWASECHGFKEVTYKNLYKGVDMKVYTKDNQLKYDFIVSPSGNVKKLKIKYIGAEKLKIKDGNLFVFTSLGYMTELKPYAYQMDGNNEVKITCNFVLQENEVTFDFPNGYDKSLPLIIDPTLMFATYSGSYANNFGYTATFDKFGFLYAGNSVFGNGYPTTTGAYAVQFGGPNKVPYQYGTHNIDIGITKYDTSGLFRVYSTYLGGGRDELPHSFVVNNYNELFILGTTSSTDFPTSKNAYDTTFNGGSNINLQGGLGMSYVNGSDFIVARLSANGSQLLSSTYIGGSGNDGVNYTSTTPSQNLLRYNYADEVRGEIDIDDQNNIYIVSCTRSTDFPIVGNTFQTKYGGGPIDGVVVKLDNSLSNIIWSSYIGGEKHDAAYSLAIDGNQDIWIAGGTNSDSLFPITPGVVDSTYKGGRSDGFITHFTKDGSAILHSTYWGSDQYDQNYFIELDRHNNVYVFGQTEAKDSTFIKDAGYYTFKSGQFISKLTPNVDSVMNSMVFGTGSGGPNISPTAFLVDLCNKIYLSGWGGADNRLGGLYNNAGWTTGMDTTAGAFQTTTDGSDFYLMVLEDDFSKLVYGTFAGGNQAAEHVDGGTSRFDRKGKIYQSVCAGCHYPLPGYSDFPVKPAYGTAQLPDSNLSNCNNLVFKMDFNIPSVVADFVAPPIGCSPYNAQFINTSLIQQNTNYQWDFGDGSAGSTTKNPSHTYTKPGTYVVTLILSDTNTCNLGDTAQQIITIIGDTSYTISPLSMCEGGIIQIGLPPNADTSITYLWNPGSGVSDSTVSNPFVSPSTTTTYTLYISNGICTDTVSQTINVIPIQANAGNRIDICLGDSVTLIGNSTGTGVSFHWSTNSWFGDQLNIIPTDSTARIAPLTSGYYYFKATNSLGCFATDTVYVDVHSADIDASLDVSICQGDTANIYVINLGTDSLTYQWKPTTGIVKSNADSSSLFVTPALTTTYIVTGTSIYGCSAMDTVVVGVSTLNFGQILAIVDKDTIISGETTTLHAKPQPGFKYSWSPTAGLSDPTSANPQASPTTTTKYKVTISDPNFPGCDKTAEVTVTVIDVVCGEPDIYIPNAFTPNNDGENDVLYVRGNNIKELYFAVYDRWGEKVFDTKDQNVGWDGTFKGREADPAVFVYYLEVTCIGNETYFKKGNVTLIR